MYRARTHLHENSPRIMAVLKPIKVILNNIPCNSENNTYVCTVPNYPFDVTRGQHQLTIHNEIYIDADDYRSVDSEDFFGLSVNKSVGLKYCLTDFSIYCTKAVESEGETILYCDCIRTTPDTAKPKGVIHWVNVRTAIPCEVNICIFTFYMCWISFTLLYSFIYLIIYMHIYLLIYRSVYTIICLQWKKSKKIYGNNN